jgi:hypothetical protein
MRSEFGVGHSLEQPMLPSRAGGAAPDTELTPEVLANMSDETFAEILNDAGSWRSRETHAAFSATQFIRCTFLAKISLEREG